MFIMTAVEGSFVFYCERLSKKNTGNAKYQKTTKLRNNTNHVDICSLLDQGGYNVLMEDPSCHMQGRHPAVVHSINISTIAGENFDSRQSPVAY